jgi:hypothetical protein
MRPTIAQHPADADLTVFALGALTGTTAEWVGRHLADCPTCRAAVERIAAGKVIARPRGPNATRVAAPHAATPSLQGLATHGQRPQPVRAVAPDDIPAALRDHPRYRIIRQLGQGGMGVVYQAEHRMMGRLVAVKVINRELLDYPDAVERFDREVRAAGKLDHPNIVKAFDAERVGDLQILAMEYVEGLSLADVLAKKGPLPVVHACNYARQAALGLQHAHELGMVHRDLKPHNLMLTPRGLVKILDFGLARLASEHPTHGGLTPSDAVLGTPQYLAPEQAQDTKAADIRADIYSLGCTLFHLLAGRPPFTGESALQVIIAHKEKAPPRLKKLRPEVPTELAELVARMLAKHPALRPQTPRAIAEALAPFAKPPAKRPASPADADAPNGSPAGVVAEKGPSPRVAGRAWRRLLTVAVPAGVLLGVLAAGIVLKFKTKQTGAGPGPSPATEVAVPVANRVPTADDRSFWRFAPQLGSGYFRRLPDGWWEETGYHGDQHHTWEELARTPEYVELYDRQRNYKTRLGAGRAWSTTGRDSTNFGPGDAGNWERPDGRPAASDPTDAVTITKPGGPPAANEVWVFHDEHRGQHYFLRTRDRGWEEWENGHVKFRWREEGRTTEAVELQMVDSSYHCWLRNDLMLFRDRPGDVPFVLVAGHWGRR